MERPGLIDLGWGHPPPSALPVEAWSAATAEALRTHSWRALTYGRGAGPGPLVEWLCEHLGRVDARAPEPGEVFVTAGASQALELLAGMLTRPGDVVLVDSPTYHLALRILADHHVELRPAPSDGAGIDPAATRALVRRLTSAGHRVPLLYLVPTFGNPTGESLVAPRRAGLAELTRDTGLTIVEDDAYRELGYGGPAPPSLWAVAGGRGVVRVGSFSKTVGPGLRLGWITADAELVCRLADRGMVDSGGGLNHTTALAMAALGTSGRYAEHVAQVRQGYRRQRDALVRALAAEASALGATAPAGGWFLWLTLPDGLTAPALLAAAERHGVSFLTGERFHVRPVGTEHARLSFSRYGPDELADAAARLGRALGEVTRPCGGTADTGGGR
ncbi:MAG TPA: PLP-dependent aminotransferase family protein [Pseudonocardiaceae bacterium]